MRVAKIVHPIRGWDGNHEVRINEGEYRVLDYVEDNYGRGFVVDVNGAILGIDASHFEYDVNEQGETIAPDHKIVEESHD